jgi:hypothetical protein
MHVQDYQPLTWRDRARRLTGRWTPRVRGPDDPRGQAPDGVLPTSAITSSRRKPWRVWSLRRRLRHERSLGPAVTGPAPALTPCLRSHAPRVPLTARTDRIRVGVSFLLGVIRRIVSVDRQLTSIPLDFLCFLCRAVALHTATPTTRPSVPLAGRGLLVAICVLRLPRVVLVSSSTYLFEREPRPDGRG